MKKAGKITIYILLALFVIIGSALTYVKVALPNVGDAPDLKVALTAEKIERGRYLANHVTICVDCHSTRDWSKLTAPILEGPVGGGGEKFDEAIGLPGSIYSANITPHNLGKWTDGEIFRAVTTGVKKDGSAIFPIMPYDRYREMDKEDIYAIIAYLRSLPAVETTTPKRRLDFPVNFIVNTIPKKADSKTLPAPTAPGYGAYVANAAACMNCHTDEKEGKWVGEPFAGKRSFTMPGGEVSSANITPDQETGIGSWTKEAFVARFKSYTDSAYVTPNVSGNEFQTVMPWTMYSGMKTSDLEAIYEYLRTVKPVKNKVVKFVPAKL
ncbi:MAG: c-type cytochrome [Ferruginibacter sp.]|nr:c-type cytochrome [Ferruginibacter sp.]